VTHHAMWTDAEWAAARGITVRQPWAWAIAVGAKLVENRSAGFPRAYTGPLLIHAGLALSARGNTDNRVLNLADEHPAHDVRGAVIAVAELADIHPDAGCCRPWGESEYVGSDQQLHRGVTHLVLENVVRLQEPVQHRGALGLWRPNEQALELIGAQVGRGNG
jgi:hypothetical protein